MTPGISTEFPSLPPSNTPLQSATPGSPAAAGPLPAAAGSSPAAALPLTPAQAIAQLDAARSRPEGKTLNPADAAQRLVAAHEARGIVGLPEFLDRNPIVARSLALLPEAQVELLLDQAVAKGAKGVAGWLRPAASSADESCMKALRTFVEGRVQNLVHTELRAVTQWQLRALDTVRADLVADPDTCLAQLRSAKEGTPEAEIAELLGIQGDPGDRARALLKIAEAKRGLEDFRDRAMDLTQWSHHDFPRASGRALDSMGYHGAASGSLAAAQTEPEKGLIPAADRAMKRAYAAGLVDVLEPVLSDRTPGLPPGFEVAKFGLLIGLRIHEGVSMTEEAFVATGRSLGL